MSTQYRLVQSGKTASGGCSAGQGSSEPIAPRIKIKKKVYSRTLSTERKVIETSIKMLTSTELLFTFFLNSNVVSRDRIFPFVSDDDSDVFQFHTNGKIYDRKVFNKDMNSM
jgi:hypothetical protein